MIPLLAIFVLAVGAETAPRNLIVDRDGDDYIGLPAYLRYLEPESPGRPDRTTVIGPDAPASFDLQWNSWLRLDPAAERDGWRMAVDTWNGALWPVRGETRTFFSNCIGSTWIQLERPEDDGLFTDPLSFSRKIEVNVALRPPFLRAGVPPYYSPADVWPCSPMNPPRRRIHGELKARYMGDAIVLRVHDRFALLPPSKCRVDWQDVRLEGDATVQRIAPDPRGPRFQAVREGSTVLSVPLRRECNPYGGLPYLGEREKVLLKVGPWFADEDPESDEFNGEQQWQDLVDEDPPDVARIALRIRPGADKTVRVEVGQLLHLDATAFLEGWRMGARTSNGVLWPVKGAPRVYRARCPGTTSVEINQLREDYPMNAPSTALGPETRKLVEVTVVAPEAGVPAECGRSFDPPRQSSHGVLNGHNVGRGILLSQGERFVVVPPTGCEEIWKDLKIEDPTIAVRLPGDGRNFPFQALRRGKSVLSVPFTCSNDEHFAAHFRGERRSWLLVVE